MDDLGLNQVYFLLHILSRKFCLFGAEEAGVANELCNATRGSAVLLVEFYFQDVARPELRWNPPRNYI